MTKYWKETVTKIERCPLLPGVEPESIMVDGSTGIAWWVQATSVHLWDITGPTCKTEAAAIEAWNEGMRRFKS